MNTKKQYNVVIGIDFGSYGCGYSYSFMDDHNIDDGIIEGANTENKVPNEIILDDNANILEFGANCIQYLIIEGINSGNYFKGIKMHLYKKKKVIKAINTGKIFDLLIVIQKVLEKIKKISENNFQKSGKNLNNLNIKWVVTVPAIWDESQKEIMMKACINAGFIKENDDKSSFFALEPEAASLYCSKFNTVDKELTKEGKYYIICDLGGGTGDIVIHLVGKNENLEEVVAPFGKGEFGSNEIDKNFFEKIIFKIFGIKDFECLFKKIEELNIKEEKETIFKEWCELEREIKHYKEGITFERVKNNLKFPINFTLFKECFKIESLQYLINKYNSNNEIKLDILGEKKWIIKFPYKIFYNFIEKQAKLIAEEINNNLKPGKNIETIIFVGGYSSNNVLITLIKQYLNNKIKNHIIPTEPFKAVKNGAVLFGLNPKKIFSRIAKYTIGEKVRNIWDDQIHSKLGLKNKIYDEDAKVYRCANCFDKFVEIGQKIGNDQLITKTYSLVNKRYGKIIFYKTENSNPILISEEGVEEIGNCLLDAGKDYPFGERDIKVTLKFGGTSIDVKAIHVKSGKEVKAKFEFN